MPHRHSAITILTYIQSGYPDGVIPGADYAALLTVLKQHLPIDDVVRVATELVVRGTSPLTGLDLRAAMNSRFNDVRDADRQRVRERLRCGGWSLGETA